MNKRKRNALVKALLSGDYEQTRNFLREGDSFCCLGVACDINLDMHWHQLRTSYCTEEYISSCGEPNEDERGITWDGNEMPTKSQLKSLGMSADEALRLSTLNDSGKSFYYIASWLMRYC